MKQERKYKMHIRRVRRGGFEFIVKFRRSVFSEINVITSAFIAIGDREEMLLLASKASRLGLTGRFIFLEDKL